MVGSISLFLLILIGFSIPFKMLMAIIEGQFPLESLVGQIFF